jgi:hypothetical protein
MLPYPHRYQGNLHSKIFGSIPGETMEFIPLIEGTPERILPKELSNIMMFP